MQPHYLTDDELKELYAIVRSNNINGYFWAIESDNVQLDGTYTIHQLEAIVTELKKLNGE